MGCFGIGVSRLLAAALEHGLSNQERRLIWPPTIAPYHICVACLAQVPIMQQTGCMLCTCMGVLLFSIKALSTKRPPIFYIFLISMVTKVIDIVNVACLY